MSLAVNLTMKLTQQVTAALKNLASGLDVEIIERHHRFKEDSPSGTALKFGQIVADELQRDSDIQSNMYTAAKVSVALEPAMKSATTPFVSVITLGSTPSCLACSENALN